VLNKDDATLLIDKMYVLPLVALTAGIPKIGWPWNSSRSQAYGGSDLIVFENNFDAIPSMTLIGHFTRQRDANMLYHRTRNMALLSSLGERERM
jgi:hypothetical protein